MALFTGLLNASRCNAARARMQPLVKSVQVMCPEQAARQASHDAGHLRVELPPDAVLTMVERQIEGIADRTGTHLRVQHDSEGPCIIIEGEPAKADVAARFVKHILQVVIKGAVVQCEMNIPIGMEGRVIGTDGRNIKAIAEASGAFMRVQGPGKLFTRGSPEQVHRAGRFVKDIVEKKPRQNPVPNSVGRGDRAAQRTTGSTCSAYEKLVSRTRDFQL